MKKVLVVTLDEEFEKARVKAHVRTRKGKLERVQEFQRKGEGKKLNKVEATKNVLKKFGIKAEVYRLEGDVFGSPRGTVVVAPKEETPSKAKKAVFKELAKIDPKIEWDE